MSPKSRILLFLLVSASIWTQGQSIVGGYEPIKNPERDSDVQKAATFAVEAQNKKIQGSIVLVKILSAESQVVAGTNYRIVIAVTEGGVSKKYTAVVYVRPWQNYRELVSFSPSY